MVFALISHPDCLLHEISQSHPEQPARIRVIEEAILNSEFKEQIKRYNAPLAEYKHLIRVHNEEYIKQIFELSPIKNTIALDLDTSMNPFTLQAALRAAGAVVNAVDLILSGEVNSAFCNVRPPGHHAMRDKAMGFCIFNNVAVGVAHAFEEYKIKHILIFDFDVHHGNGTEDIFKQNQQVLFCSTFQYPLYPVSGLLDQSAHIIKMPFAAGTGGERYIKTVQERCFNLIKAFKPEMVFFSAGFDGHYRENIADFNLNENDFALLTAKIRQVVEEDCKGRFVSVLEGGYNLEILGKNVVAHIRELID